MGQVLRTMVACCACWVGVVSLGSCCAGDLVVLIAFDACIGMGIVGEGSLSWCGWTQEKKLRRVKMLYDVGIGIRSGPGLHAVGSRVGELAAGSLCVVGRLIAGLPNAPCVGVC